jgi:predicted nucleic acid-binding protein
LTAECIVSNSACLIALERIEQLDLLPLVYPTIWIPQAVKREIGFTTSWLQVQTVKNQALVSTLRSQVGAGESEAIALALEIQTVPVLLDDKKARRIAEQLDLQVTGTVGLLLKAKKQGVLPAIRPVLDALERVDFRISSRLRNRALELAEES